MTVRHTCRTQCRHVPAWQESYCLEGFHRLFWRDKQYGWEEQGAVIRRQRVRQGGGSQCRGGSRSYPTSGSHRSVAERVIVMSKCLFMFDLSSRSFYPLWWWVQLRIPGLLFWWHISLLLWAVELQCSRCSTCHMYVFPPDISCTSLINDVLQELVPVFTASSFYFFLKSLLSLAPVK